VADGIAYPSGAAVASVAGDIGAGVISAIAGIALAIAISTIGGSSAAAVTGVEAVAEAGTIDGAGNKAIGLIGIGMTAAAGDPIGHGNGKARISGRALSMSQGYLRTPGNGVATLTGIAMTAAISPVLTHVSTVLKRIVMRTGGGQVAAIGQIGEVRTSDERLQALTCTDAPIAGITPDISHLASLRVNDAPSEAAP